MNRDNKTRICVFTEDRGFDQIHTACRLAKAISIEAAELLECFLWDEQCYDIEHVKEELADILIYCEQMMQHLNIDEDTIVEEKMDMNEMKYPI